MESFAIFWLVSTVWSFSADLINKLKIYKDLADNGYQIDNDKLAESNIRLSLTENPIITFIPIINIMNVMKNSIDYAKNKENILDYLDSLGLIKEMDPHEKEEYDQKRSLFNAFILPIKWENRLDYAIKDSYDNEGTIYFELKGHKIIILKATGTLSRLSDSDLIDKMESSNNKDLGLLVSISQKINNLESMSEEELEELLKGRNNSEEKNQPYVLKKTYQNKKK